MGYEIALSDDQRYIICRVTAAMTVDLARRFSVEIDKLSRERNIKCFLFDVRGAPNVSAVFENYKFAYQEMGDLNLQRSVRSAVLVSPGDRSHDFVETVAQNAGYNVRVFEDEQAACAWFNEEPPR